jgi:hypothetical protein
MLVTHISTRAARLFAGTALAGALVAAPAAAQTTHSFVSRPDLKPPTVEVYKKEPGTTPGKIFLGSKTGSDKGPTTGVLIVDDAGQPVWFKPDKSGQRTNDVRVQTYEDKPVLTWWEGKALGGYGEGTGVIADTSYNVIERVRMHSPFKMDMHEFKLTDRGTALVIAYYAKTYDLRPVGGPKDGKILDNVVQEIDVETGKVLFSWRSLGKIGITESYRKRSEDKGKPWDYFHVNSVNLDLDGNLLISARYSNSITKISRKTGRVVWRLGGKRSDFKMGSGTRFTLAHDAHRQPDGTIRVFDNSSKETRDRSRVLTLKVDSKRKQVTRVEDVRHPEPVLAATQANANRVEGGGLFVGWGSQGRWSEFDEDGELLYDAELADGYSSYRTYLAPWTAQPTEPPAVAAQPAPDGTTAVYASWNGATEVAAWRVLAGPNAGALAPVATAPRTGFETRVVVPGHHAHVVVEALDAAGKVLGTSKPASPAAPARRR